MQFIFIHLSAFTSKTTLDVRTNKTSNKSQDDEFWNDAMATFQSPQQKQTQPIARTTTGSSRPQPNKNSASSETDVGGWDDWAADVKDGNILGNNISHIGTALQLS